MSLYKIKRTKKYPPQRNKFHEGWPHIGWQQRRSMDTNSPSLNKLKKEIKHLNREFLRHRPFYKLIDIS
uniref:Uncharacterized protein MANES_12G118400 n=1 Tax=Rhizophora mucronata TaxID=61149 RepID=A0A2P2ISC8_RHIMU